MDSNGVSLVDAARGFAGVPKEYSPVPIWWWSAEKLDRTRLRWQLEQFAAGGVFNLVILNLAPTGPLYGSDADDPPFFSEAWWEIFLGVCADARELGVRLWFYDQIGFSGANLQGGLVREKPEYAGQWLASRVVEGEGDLAIDFPPKARRWQLPSPTWPQAKRSPPLPGRPPSSGKRGVFPEGVLGEYG